ncbi:hypothetical protein NSA56_13110 [Oceanobacillus caeni]|uniref:Uncharacterized protein n=1 Tax=Oceanobacillus caeni TaxID=405946 RepID=A0ABR5MGD9_9BACI|nr:MULTISPECIES: hypothetical protein [Bacillaceae]KKE79974.1 hypothetical protein WH51_04585 [Bacilli bacterium VT-13-104]PZD83010.1 hypothetical protein DEJ64_16745 [Bacilli bacterium]KPH71587.1 hypothetical protein AFL42_14865 [Oceanobacillus caeni]MBU8792548.1 hypothetical protein [Oceanobacillus caeni]MCR1835321.1 hypothetical protein [Oceanobacillus caeni]
MKRYSIISYTALILGLTSFLSLTPLAISRGFSTFLLVLSISGLILSLYGLFKKTEQKSLLLVALIT